MKTTRSLCLASLLAALHPLLAAGATSEATPFSTHVGDPVSIPAEIADHVIFVNVMVNGHGPFRVMVDTGCSVTLVSPELAEAVGAAVSDPEENIVVAQNALGNPTDVQRVVLGSIDLGGVHFEGVLAAISDTFDEFSAIHGRRVDGALGFPLFHDLYLGLDFPNHRILLGNQWPANVPAIRAGLPVIEQAGTPFVQVQVQGRPVDVMIDTGANHALHLTSELASAFQWKVEPRAGSLVAAVGAGVDWPAGRKPVARGHRAGGADGGHLRRPAQPWAPLAAEFLRHLPSIREHGLVLRAGHGAARAHRRAQHWP
jgi:predicted aspartyl protease